MHFFSGSVKTSYDLPFFYPSNFNQFLNGTNYSTPNSPNAINDVSNETELLITAVSGVIDNATYAEMLKLTWYSTNVTTTFETYNEYPGELIFWDSHPLSQSLILLALSKYAGMVQCGTA